MPITGTQPFDKALSPGVIARARRPPGGAVGLLPRKPVAAGPRRVLHWRMVAFEPSALTAGFGAVWAAHYQWPVLVRIDPATRRGEIFASFPDGAALAASAEPDWPPGPGAIAAGGGAVWLALSDRDQLLRVDPVSREVRAIDLPFGPSEIGAGPAASLPSARPEMAVWPWCRQRAR